MKTLSLCMIVKNEEKTLPRILEKAHLFADEIIIVDTGSTDKTKEIAQKFTTNVFDFKWIFDFSKARNFSFDKAKSEYIIWLDGDDFLLDSSIEKIVKWKNSTSNEDVLMCNYAVAYDKNLVPSYQFLRERIVKNLPQLRWHDRVHEVIIPQGKIEKREDIVVYHGKKKEHTNRNLKIYRMMIKEGEEFSARSLFYYARELYYNGYFKKAIKVLNDFLKREDGFIENKIDACLILSHCFKNLKENEKVLESLLRSFAFDRPRGEVLCEVGNYFFEKSKLREASFWYELALKTPSDLNGYGFVDTYKTSFVPSMQLVVCYYNLGDVNNALHYHEIAKSLNGENENVKHNQIFFDNLILSQKKD